MKILIGNRYSGKMFKCQNIESYIYKNNAILNFLNTFHASINIK